MTVTSCARMAFPSKRFRVKSESRSDHDTLRFGGGARTAGVPLVLVTLKCRRRYVRPVTRQVQCDVTVTVTVPTLPLTVTVVT